MKKKIVHPEELTPWYANQTLNADEAESYQAWLESHPQGEVDLRLWQEVRMTVAEQARWSPPPWALQQIQARLREPAISPGFGKRTLPAIASAAAVMVIVFVLLWVVVKPGVALRWSVKGMVPTSFRIYRAPATSLDYTLVAEIAARDDQPAYQYSDLLIFPGLSYRYRVDGVDSSGEILSSQGVTSDARGALPDQVGILLTSLICGYACLALGMDYPRLKLKPSGGALA